MINEILQNFNWPTFFFALMVFVLLTNLLNLLKAYIVKIKADLQVKLAEKKLAKLQSQLKANDQQLDMLLKQQGEK